MARATGPDHDALYHRLFSHPGVVAQLLRGFVDIDLGDADLSGMERLNTKFHAITGQRREGDMIWRIPRLGDDDAYLVLLLEFQSTSDQYMALRVLTYAGLLWQQLISEQRLMTHGRLPPILPVVVYNGDARWRAPKLLRPLVGLPEGSALWPWQPDARYHLIDAGAFSEAELEGLDGLPALWFRLENADDPGRVVAVADAVLAWFASHPGFASLRTLFVELLGATMAPLDPGIRVPADLLEVRNMLATRAEKWIEKWKQEGLQKGREEGLEQGLEEGLERGLQTGLERGLEQGHRRGEATFLLRQMERRFGTLPSSAVERVFAADTTILEAWGMRIFDAQGLDDLFGDESAQSA